MVEWLFLAVPRGCLQFVIVVFPDHTHLLFLYDRIGLFSFLGYIESTVKESETHFLLDLNYNAYKFFLNKAYFLASHIYPFLLKDCEHWALVYK